MEEVFFLVRVFFVNMFPFVCEALGSLFLVFPEFIEIGYDIDCASPFSLNPFRKPILPFREKILIRLK